jgi:nucleoside-diphosphate-sugar epimerase
MFIDDLVEALCRLAVTPNLEKNVLNIGTGVSTTIRELAEMVARVSGVEIPILHGPPRAGEVYKLECDPSKAERVLGWRPRVDLETGVEECWKWALRNRGYLLGLSED